jgi:hypothetical protein
LAPTSATSVRKLYFPQRAQSSLRKTKMRQLILSIQLIISREIDIFHYLRHLQNLACGFEDIFFVIDRYNAALTGGNFREFVMAERICHRRIKAHHAEVGREIRVSRPTRDDNLAVRLQRQRKGWTGKAGKL